MRLDLNTNRCACRMCGGEGRFLCVLGTVALLDAVSTPAGGSRSRAHQWLFTFVALQVCDARMSTVRRPPNCVTSGDRGCSDQRRSARETSRRATLCEMGGLRISTGCTGSLANPRTSPHPPTPIPPDPSRTPSEGDGEHLRERLFGKHVGAGLGGPARGRSGAREKRGNCPVSHTPNGTLLDLQSSGRGLFLPRLPAHMAPPISPHIPKRRIPPPRQRRLYIHDEHSCSDRIFCGPNCSLDTGGGYSLCASCVAVPPHHRVSDSANPHNASDPLPQSFVGFTGPP